MITDKSSYGYGDKLVISGQVETDLISGTGVQVKILIFDSNGSQIYSQANYLAGSIIRQSTPLTFAVLPDVNGYYSITQNITPNIFKEDTYTLKANYGGNLKASASFTVSNLLGTSSSGQIVANTDKKVYDVGGVVKLNGKLSSSANMDSYTLTLVKPTGNQITFPLQVNNGQFSWTWTIPKADTTGSAITSTDRSSSSVLDPTITVYGIYRIKISSTHTNADLFFQVSKNPQPDQGMSPIVVQTDKTDYVSTDVAKIWGQVIPTTNTATQEANSLVQVSIYSDNGQQVYRGDATVNQGGQFYITIPFHTGIWKTGTYKLYAEYLTNKIITSFKVTDPFSTSSAKLQLFITTDAEKYLPGQTVLITGRTSYIVSVDNVDLTFGLKNDTLISEGEVTSKKGNILPKATVSFDQFGSFSYDYKIPDNTRLGSYTIVAQVPFGAYSAYFDVVNKLPVKETPFTNMTQVTQNNVTQTIPQSTQTVAPSTIGPISQHVMSANTFIEKINKISDSTITIPLNSKSVGNGIYYPRELDGLLRVNPGDENYVVMKLSSQDGTCIIGQDSSCLVTTSTVHSGMLYQTVKIGSKNFFVGYSGGGIRLQQFSIMPESASDLIPAGQWNVNVIKKDQVTRFYYHLLYVEK
jgi:hypothetical protein